MTRKYIKDTKLFSSGKAAFRFLIPREVAESDPVTAPLVARRNTLILWFGDDRRIVMYPCRNNELLNFVCIHPDPESHATEGDGRYRPRDSGHIPAKLTYTLQNGISKAL